jgi:DNA-binding NarL/FixJ family response regulator
MMAKKKAKAKPKAKVKMKVKLPTTKREPLTMRETEVAALIAQDFGNIEIGSALGISPETVKEHIQNSLRKTKIRSRVGLAIWFVIPAA